LDIPLEIGSGRAGESGAQGSSKAQGKRVMRGARGAGGKAPMARPMTRSLSLGEIVEHPE
jgi:hypothetical protein